MADPRDDVLWNSLGNRSWINNDLVNTMEKLPLYVGIAFCAAAVAIIYFGIYF